MMILFISDALSAPFDEGIKNVAFQIHSQLKKKIGVVSVTTSGNNTENADIRKLKLNKLFINNSLRELIQDSSPDIILYLPEASITFNSFIRSMVLKRMSGISKIVMLGVQHREYSLFERLLMRDYLKPDLLLIMGRNMGNYFQEIGFNITLLPPAVDVNKFNAVSIEEKEALRREYKIPMATKVVLHVGHIKRSRNIEYLLHVQKEKNVQVVIVGSTTTQVENDLKDRLVQGGIIVIDRFIEDISVIYKMSDVYVFPVISDTDAIDMPLSVLEAMACNLPVITTRYGGLIDYFAEEAGFHYFSSVDELFELLKSVSNEKINNNEKTLQFTWDKFTDNIITACESLL